MIKIRNLSMWAKLPDNMLLELVAEQPRQVRVEVNCEQLTRVDMVVGDVPIFVGLVHGYDIIDVVIPGDVQFAFTTEGEVWYITDDERGAVEEAPVRPVSYTKIANRRARNPQLEMMMFRMEQNMNARMERLALEQAEWQRQHGAKSDTGEVVDESDSASAAGAVGGADGGNEAGSAAASGEGVPSNAGG